ncbi:MAG: hypothetical protein HY766_16455 [candidate division NC10 bacterium]|nr:hypothetical protein [candidate division NC10 bacterium]MBI4841091.1 hypothetical protein [candidate division NC10 bacterium]
MLDEREAWSPDQELRLLEELAEAQAFEVEMELPVHPLAAEAERPWVAYWHLPPNGIRLKARTNHRLARGR